MYASNNLEGGNIPSMFVSVCSHFSSCKSYNFGLPLNKGANYADCSMGQLNNISVCKLLESTPCKFALATIKRKESPAICAVGKTTDRTIWILLSVTQNIKIGLFASYHNDLSRILQQFIKTLGDSCKALPLNNSWKKDTPDIKIRRHSLL